MTITQPPDSNKMMNVLLVGSGGREHALAWKIALSPLLTKLYIAPGNPGTMRHGENVPVDAANIPLLLDIIDQKDIDFVVIGPEAALAAGLADECLAAGIPVFGPVQAAARIESSKAFAKQIMQAAGVPTAESYSFDDATTAAAFVRQRGQVWVVKADGLAGGKGVIVPDTVEATLDAIVQLDGSSGGEMLLLEQKLSGPEVSIIALCDGKTLFVLPPAQDHKRLREGDQGPNTGGMGAFAPSPLVDDPLLALIVEQCMLPVVRELAARGTPFRGALFAGIMLTDQGPMVLEFNARFGDPETQALLMLVDGDLLAALRACADGDLEPDMLRWRDGAAACVVLAAAGYPESPRRGEPISGIEAVEQFDTVIFHAGTEWQNGQFVTAGGRVLSITSAGRSLHEAIERAYAALEPISFAGMQYRRDIGRS